jgi:hypothetical protein
METAKGIIAINGVEVLYQSHMSMGNEYIVTYLDEYPFSVRIRLSQIVEIINNCKSDGVIPYNTLSECNKIATRLHYRLNFTQLDCSIIIAQWVTKKKIVLGGSSHPYNEEEVCEIYGNQLCITGVSFHCLNYVNFCISGHGEVHIAVDASGTSRCDKYCAHLCVGSSLEELEKIVKARYQYEYFVLCDPYDDPHKAIDKLRVTL